jgi:hypothetical protein
VAVVQLALDLRLMPCPFHPDLDERPSQTFDVDLLRRTPNTEI